MTEKTIGRGGNSVWNEVGNDDDEKIYGNCNGGVGDTKLTTQKRPNLI